MKIKIIFVLFLTLFFSGCDIDNNNHGYGYEYDEISRDGIALIFEAEKFPVDLDFIDSVYYEAKQCTGLTAPPPPYIVVKEEEYRFMFDGISVYAAIRYDPDLILVSNKYIEDFGILMHEFIHYLLHNNGIDQGPDKHSLHVDLYVSCGAHISKNFTRNRNI